MRSRFTLMRIGSFHAADRLRLEELPFLYQFRYALRTRNLFSGETHIVSSLAGRTWARPPGSVNQSM
jgi:hypothetical protein